MMEKIPDMVIQEYEDRLRACRQELQTAREENRRLEQEVESLRPFAVPLNEPDLDYQE